MSGKLVSMAKRANMKSFSFDRFEAVSRKTTLSFIYIVTLYIVTLYIKETYILCIYIKKRVHSFFYIIHNIHGLLADVLLDT